VTAGPCRRVIVCGGAPAAIDAREPSNVVGWSSGIVLQEVWATPPAPFEFEANPDPSNLMTQVIPGATRWIMTEIPADSATASAPVVHATNSVDFVTVVSGSVDLITADRTVELGPGDCVVQLGAEHAWQNRGSAPCVMSVIMLGTDWTATGQETGTVET